MEQSGLNQDLKIMTKEFVRPSSQFNEMGDKIHILVGALLKLSIFVGGKGRLRKFEAL